MRATRRMMAALLSAAMLIGGMVLAGAGPASAQSAEPLGQGYVTDDSGVLTDSQEEALEQRLAKLAATDGLPELYVILVPQFTYPSNALKWADETARLSHFGPDQYLLAIATEGRSLAISAEYDSSQPGPLSESRVLKIEDQLGADYLSHDDWNGGIEFVADEFSEVPWPWWVWLVGIAVVALLIFGLTRLVLHLRRRAALRAELRTLEGQKKRASRQLVLTDEAVRTSEQELGFVTAEFGDETTAEYATVLKECRTRLQEAFELLEKLEDSEPDTTADTRSWTDKILALCAGVERDLDDRKKSLAALRALTADAQATLARLKTARADAAGLEEESRNRLAVLKDAVPAAQLVGVAGNPDEIARRLRAADEQIATLEKAVAAKRSRAILKTVHEVERLLAEATGLRDAVIAQADAVAAGAPPAAAAAAASAASGATLEQARTAVHAAELSVQARPGTVGAMALRLLSSAQQDLKSATASTDPAEVRRQAASAVSAAQRVQSLLQTPVASGARFAASEPVRERPLMYDSTTGSSRSSWSSASSRDYDDDGPSLGKALWGAITGGVSGGVIGGSISDGEPGMALLMGLGGLVIGGLSGAFGGSSGGSSSGWGGSSHSSWSSGSSYRSHSRSSRSFSSRSSSRSHSSSRSSGRSGGRHF